MTNSSSDIMEVFKTLLKSELIDFVLDMYKERTKDNEINHISKYQQETKILDRIISQFFFLSFTIRDPNEKDKFPGRFFCSIHYINTIANNFYIIKELFTKGFHVQLQQFMRIQFECVNNLIAFIGDDDFFQRFGTDDGKDLMISPKPIHSQKSIKKIFKELTNDAQDNIWNIFKDIMNFIYNDLSESVHGNIPRITLQSLENSQIDSYNKNICGVEYPLPVTLKILRDLLYYFQIVVKLLHIQIDKKDMFDKQSPFFEFVDYYKDKLELIIREDEI